MHAVKEQKPWRKRDTVISVLGYILLAYGTAFGLYISVESLQLEYQYDRDCVEGEGQVIGFKEVKTSPRRSVSITFLNAVIDSEHGELELGNGEQYEIGQKVRYEYSPSQKYARHPGKSNFLFHLASLLLFVFFGAIVFVFVPLVFLPDVCSMLRSRVLPVDSGR